MRAAPKKPAKLLFYLPGLVDGGAERVMADLAAAFHEDGCDLLFVTDFKAEGEGAKLPSSMRTITLGGNHIRSTLKLAEVLRRLQPDLAISAIAGANVKLVLASLICAARSAIGFNRRHEATRLVLGYHGFEEYKTGWLSWLGYVGLPLLSRYADRILAVSDSLRAELVSRWKALPRRTVRIYNPVTLPQSSEPAPARDPETKTILSVGRLVPGKRFDLLIEAFGRLEDPRTKLVILGEGGERRKLEQLVDKLGLAGRVQLAGYQSDTAPWYAAADCFALASEMESFGLVLVEALAFGLPVVSADSGGPREVLDNGRYGALLTDPDAEAFAKALGEALAEPGDPVPRQLRANTFSFDSGYKQYETLFRQLLGRAPADM